MKRTKSMSGIEIYATANGAERVGIAYFGTKRPGEARTPLYREMVGTVAPDPESVRGDVAAIRYRKRLDGKYRDCPVCIEALRLLDARKADVQAARDRDEFYLSPKERAEAEEQARKDAETAAANAAQAADAARLPLLFETCAASFVKQASADYARPEEKASHVRMLVRYFGGRTVDAISKRDVLSYFEARVNAAAPFATLRRVEPMTVTKRGKRRQAWRVVAEDGRPLSKPLPTLEEAEARASERPGPRAPRTEIDTLSAVFNYLLDPAEDGAASFPATVRALAPGLQNPALGWRPRRRVGTKAGKLEYKPSHVPTVPTSRELGAILEGAPSPLHRAAWALAYYTASRPESELCALTLGDLVYSDDARARFARSADGTVLGWVTFRDTKTGEAARSVPLDPEAEAALKAAGLPEKPTRTPGEPEAAFEARAAAWAAAPVFAKRAGRNAGTPWDRYSYRKAWHSTLRAAMRLLRADDPEARDISGAWVRDFRKAAISDTRAAGTDGAVASKIAGHSEEMSYHYTQATDEAARAAIRRLKRPERAVGTIPNRIAAVSE